MFLIKIVPSDLQGKIQKLLMIKTSDLIKFNKPIFYPILIEKILFIIN